MSQFPKANFPIAAPGELNTAVAFDSDIVGRLRDISNRTLKLATRSALGKAATRIKGPARAATPVYTGLLRQSLEKKDSKHTSKAIYSLVGARRKIEGPAIKGYVKKAKAAKRAGKPFVVSRAVTRKRKPSRYLHLVEKGFRTRGGGFKPGVGMLSRAISSTKAEVIEVVRVTLSERLMNAKSSDQITST